MKPKDALLERWETILAQKGEQPAIFNTRGEVVRTFLQVEERARQIEAKMPAVKPHNVSAIQIGNHDDAKKRVAEACASGQIGRPVARIHVAHSD